MPMYGANAFGNLRSRMRSPLPKSAIWNAADKAASIDLSTDQLTATNPASGSGIGLIRGLTAIPLGPFYLEYLVGVGASATSNAVGFCDASVALNAYAGGVVGGAVLGFDGTAGSNGAYIGKSSAFVAGDVIMLAFSPPAKRWWVGKNGTFNGDPATQASPMVMTYSGSQPLFYPCANLSRTGAAATLLNASTNRYAPPAGYPPIA